MSLFLFYPAYHLGDIVKKNFKGGGFGKKYIKEGCL